MKMRREGVILWLQLNQKREKWCSNHQEYYDQNGKDFLILGKQRFSRKNIDDNYLTGKQTFTFHVKNKNIIQITGMAFEELNNYKEAKHNQEVSMEKEKKKEEKKKLIGKIKDIFLKIMSRLLFV